MNYKKIHIFSLAICIPLIILFINLAIWQKSRHIEKIQIKKELNQRLVLDYLSIDDLKQDINELEFRKINLKGEFIYKDQVYLRNRKFKDLPGFYVITPFKLSNKKAILVNRGFIPLGSEKKVHKTDLKEISGIVKKSKTRNFKLQPKESFENSKNKKLKYWLRVDTKNIKKQLNFDIYDLYIDLLPNDITKSSEVIKKSDNKSELLFLGKTRLGYNTKIDEKLPVAIIDTIIPEARHLGYVYEWSFMALLTFIILIYIQIKKLKGFKVK